MVILPFGDRSLLAEVASLDEVLALHARLAATRPAGVVDLVPAARTVLVRVDPSALPVSAARAWIEGADATPAEADRSATPLVEVPIVYDGVDLADVASLLGVSTDALAAEHAAADWTVAFTGFAPGFGYLVSADWRHDVPRLSTPRTRVPAGAVGVAGEFTGAYPRETPGGWRLLGTTPAQLFDPARSRAALLHPGERVRFVPTRATAFGAADARTDAAPARAAVDVVAAGPLTTIQDQGRPGHLAEGVARSGAADRAALRTANRLVGNVESAAGLEVTVGGFRATARTDLWVAVAGAWGPIRIGGREVDPFRAHRWPAGADLEVGAFTAGIRGYVAIRGGVAASPVLDSRATDVMAGLGPARLAAGDGLALADETAGEVPPEDLHPWTPPGDALDVPVAAGPRADWFTAEARALLFDAVWSVTADADRVGLRLDGPALERIRHGELPSEGMLPGALQVPPSGRPVVLGPDGPVTGGYPVIAVITDDGLDALAQARPGTRVRFRHARAV
ncbi:urea amidolyase family protein [Microbacterium dauci]|uniref:Urea amidolyase family protein n=1 Tax=Microbacterium dauci TaxID=3048008 RepID=A0ABT6ZE10_9MICO|nr:urea amidolyase family protein [Microbacterium sp. LX3-4]MDJ1114378.1 urea amidolyase family protein [Microbacterium sp. LX3-4]